MKKLLSFLLSSVILMGSSVVTLADTKIDNSTIGGNNDKIEVDSEINVKNDSLTLSGNNISIKIKTNFIICPVRFCINSIIFLVNKLLSPAFCRLKNVII